MRAKDKTVILELLQKLYKSKSILRYSFLVNVTLNDLQLILLLYMIKSLFVSVSLHLFTKNYKFDKFVKDYLIPISSTYSYLRGNNFGARC